MDLVRRRVTRLVRLSMDRAAFADRLDRFGGISGAWRGLDSNDRARRAIYFAR